MPAPQTNTNCLGEIANLTDEIISLHNEQEHIRVGRIIFNDLQGNELGMVAIDDQNEAHFMAYHQQQ